MNLIQIAQVELPQFRANIRDLQRKEIAKRVRELLREMKLTAISVTTPNYRGAQGVLVTLPRCALGETLETRNAARAKVRAVILAAFPDLDDRSDSQNDTWDYRIQVE